MFAYKEAWKSICGSTKTSFTSSLFEGWTTTKKWSLWYIRYSLKGLNEFTTIPKAPAPVSTRRHESKTVSDLCLVPVK